MDIEIHKVKGKLTIAKFNQIPTITKKELMAFKGHCLGYISRQGKEQFLLKETGKYFLLPRGKAICEKSQLQVYLVDTTGKISYNAFFRRKSSLTKWVSKYQLIKKQTLQIFL